jgi:pimeloyl-ACP methyl ester carboxylesterase
MRPKTNCAAALLSLALSVTHTSAVAQPAADGYQPRFEEAACPFDASPQALEQVRCGWLVVPQNRAEPEGKQVRLAVAVLKSTSATPRPDPIVFLSGGPGGRSVEYMPQRTKSAFWNRLRAERDVIFYDQRGTGYSEPAFCPEVTEEHTRALFLGLSAQQRSARMQTVLTRCAGVMRERGVDLSQVNSVASALDLRDLRRALGYEEWNLLGVSYGSTLALEAMRSAPEGIRSVLLDGPAPPNARIDDETPANFADVVRRLAAACAADAACDASHPELEQRVWRTVEELDADPWIVRGGSRIGLPDPLVLDGYLFASALFQGLYMQQFLQITPLFVQEVGRRNTPMVLAVAGPLSGSLRDIDRAMYLAVQCYESIPFNRPGARQAKRGRYPEILDRVGFGSEAGDAAVCDAWHPFRAAPERVEPVRSAIPTLVFTGEFDPITHRDYGALAVAALPSAHVVDAPAMGHGVSPFHECTRSMLLAFFDDPHRTPDRACVTGEMEPLRFVTDVRVAAGVSRLAGVMGSPNPPKLLPASLGLPLLVLLGSVVSWPLAAGMRRLRRRERLVRTPFERRAWWAAIGVMLLALAFAGALAWVLVQTAGDNPMILAFGLPGWAAPLLLVPWILLAGSLALVATAALAWRRGAWTRWGRIHFTLVAAASAVFTAVLFLAGLV